MMISYDEFECLPLILQIVLFKTGYIENETKQTSPLNINAKR